MDTSDGRRRRGEGEKWSSEGKVGALKDTDRNRRRGETLKLKQQLQTSG